MTSLFDRLRTLLGRHDRKLLDWHQFDQTQFDGSSEDARKRQIIIGLDFGTSFTKVVIGSAADHFAVPFNELVDKGNPNLLPSALSQVGSAWQPGNSNEAQNVIDGLKLRLLNEEYTVAARARCAAFLALTLRYARAWFLRAHEAQFGNSWIVWRLNLGVPAESYHSSKLASVYASLAKLAWDLSVLPGTLTYERVKRYVQNETFSDTRIPDSYSSRLLPRKSIHIVPEFVAQLAAYVRSTQYKEGLHALVDIGGGTMDFAVFNIGTRDGEFEFWTFFKAVRKLGTLFLAEHRCTSVQPPVAWRPLPFSDFPSDQEFAQRIGTTLQELTEVDQQLLRQIPSLMARGFDETRTDMGYTNPDTWREGVPVFLCGGGSKVNAYRRAIFAKGSYHRLPIYERRLPIPERFRFERVAREDYDRLSVAYGLSFSAEDIGEIFRTDQVPPFVPVQSGSHASDGRICPKCKGTGGPHPANPCPTCGGSGWIH